MKKRSALFLALLTLCLLALAACGEKEKVRTGTVYVPEDVSFYAPLKELEGFCIAGDSLYLLGTSYASNDLFSLLRISMDDGRTENLKSFHPAQLPLEEDANQNSYTGYLRPGADGTLWSTEEVAYRCYDLPEGFDPEEDGEEMYKYISDRGRALFLRQLDGEGNELSSFRFSNLAEALSADQIYDLWTDGAGTFFANTGGAVFLMDEAGAVRATLEGEHMDWNRFVPLGDGRVAILDTVQTVDGGETRLRVIDAQAGAWAEDAFPLPFDAKCFLGGSGADTLFYYKHGDTLYAWRQGAEEPEQVMNWLESGIDANGLEAFGFLSDGRLAAFEFVVDLDRLDLGKIPNLIVLTPTDASSMPERTVVTLAANYLDPSMRAEIAAFNQASQSCFISATEYLFLRSDEAVGEKIQLEVEQAAFRMSIDLTTGKTPDIIYFNRWMPAREMEAQGMLEDLWPYIEADPDLGRDALMTRPLEAMEYNGGLYRIWDGFSICTAMGRKDVVGDRLSWTYDDLWAAYEKLPEGSPVTHTSDYKRGMLENLAALGMSRFVDWENGVSRFDGEEFRDLLEFCNRFPDERDPMYPSGNWPVAASVEDWLAVGAGEQLLVDFGISNFLQLGEWKCYVGRDISCVGMPCAGGQVNSAFSLNGDATLGITAASKHKEEAWSFLRQWLLPRENLEQWAKNYAAYSPLPINRSDFEQLAELVMTPRMEEKDGVLQQVPWISTHMTINDQLEFDLTVDVMTQEEYDQIMELYNAAEGIVDYNPSLMNIIIEQAGPYFAGDKSLDDTVASIQGRVGLYLAELQ